MTSRLPETIEPFKLVDRRVTLSGSIEVSGMKRLLPSLVSEEGQVSLEFKFYRDEVGRPVLHGELSTELMMCCQRCMQEMPVRIDTAVHIALISREKDAAEISPELEPLLVEDSSLSLQALVEDEVILALPLVALHESQACNEKLTAKAPEQVQEQKPNPFAVLATLKQRENKD